MERTREGGQGMQGPVVSQRYVPAGVPIAAEADAKDGVLSRNQHQFVSKRMNLGGTYARRRRRRAAGRAMRVQRAQLADDDGRGESCSWMLSLLLHHLPLRAYSIMAPLSTAILSTLRYERQDGTLVYSANIDVEWSVFGNPHGGALLALVLNTLNHVQASSKPGHPDPAHLTAQFLKGASEGPATIEVKRVKTGRNWSNLEAVLIQGGETLVKTQALYTAFPDLPSNPSQPFSSANQNLLPYTPSAYAPLSPFLTHPALCDSKPRSNEAGRRWSSESVFWFTPSRMIWSEDLAIKAKREGTNPDAKKGEGLKLDWGAWCELKDDVQTIAMLGSVHRLYS